LSLVLLAICFAIIQIRTLHFRFSFFPIKRSLFSQYRLAQYLIGRLNKKGLRYSACHLHGLSVSPIPVSDILKYHTCPVSQMMLSFICCSSLGVGLASLGIRPPLAETPLDLSLCLLILLAMSSASSVSEAMPSSSSLVSDALLWSERKIFMFKHNAL